MADVPTDTNRHTIVLASGDPVAAHLADQLDPAGYVIAADAGLHLADGLGLHVDLVVGDLDSVDPGRLAAAEAAGAVVDRHPIDKDRTDLAIALDTAVAAGAERITVVGGTGGRLDHLLANALLLAAAEYAACDLRLLSEDGLVTVVRGHGELSGAPDDLVSLLPVHGRAEDVETTGLAYPLRREPLDAGSSRGVSNRLVGTTATVRLTTGVLLAVQPAPTAPPTHDPREPA